MRIWAKSDGTSLADHTLDVMGKVKELWKAVKPNIRLKILKTEELERMLLVAAFAHDFGKVWPQFQWDLGNKVYMKNNMNDLEKEDFPHIQHNLLSVFFLNKEKALDFITKDKDKWNTVAPLLYSAITFHHWRTDSKSILYGIKASLRASAGNLLKPWEDRCFGEALEEKLLEELKEKEEEFKKQFYKNWTGLVTFHKNFAEQIANGETFIQTKIFYPPYTLEFLPQRIKNIVEDEKENFDWVFLAGFLMRADHFASWLEREKLEKEKKEKTKIEIKFPKVNFRAELEKKGWWQAEVVKDLKDQNVILIAPTGIGKTEFAFVWGEGSKFIFTLPLRVATNQIFERANKAFMKEEGTSEARKEGEEKKKDDEKDLIVGLLHSDADIFLVERNEDQEGEAFLTLELSRHLSLPIIIATGDQFFPAALRYPGYEKIYATLGYSRLIIDEVQAYNPRAAAIVVKLIKDISALGGKFLLMTATLPEFVEKALEGLTYKKIDLFNKGKFNFPKKHKVEIKKGDIKDSAKEIVEKAENGRRMLVVVNTVEKAQEVYEDISKNVEGKSIETVLLHSRFTWENRREKEEDAGKKLEKREEKELKEALEKQKGVIIVATQIVEASLNIDADYLYTEIAPSDSLVQRMGRVLRGIRPAEKGKVWDKNHYEEIYKKEANIKIFVNEKKENNRKYYESGKGRVYKNYLIEATLLVLNELAKNVGKDGILKKWMEQVDQNRKGKKKEVKEVSKEELLEKLKERVKEVLKDITEPVFFEETKKAKWVREVYNTDFLEKIGYLQDFYNTLAVLEAGYVSERKDEAHRLFRDIRSVNVIPSAKMEEAMGELKEFAEGKKTYTDFKKNFIDKFVVSVNESTLKWKYKKELSLFTDHLSEEIPRRLNHHLQGIYLVDLEYSERKGLLPPGGKTGKEQQENE